MFFVISLHSLHLTSEKTSVIFDASQLQKHCVPEPVLDFNKKSLWHLHSQLMNHRVYIKSLHTLITLVLSVNSKTVLRNLWASHCLSWQSSGNVSAWHIKIIPNTVFTTLLYMHCFTLQCSQYCGKWNDTIECWQSLQIVLNAARLDIWPIGVTNLFLRCYMTFPVAVVLSPDPTLSQGKGSGDYRVFPWLCQGSNFTFE